MDIKLLKPNNRLASLKNKKNGGKRNASIGENPTVNDIYKSDNKVRSSSKVRTNSISK